MDELNHYTINITQAWYMQGIYQLELGGSNSLDFKRSKLLDTQGTWIFCLGDDKIELTQIERVIR